MDHLKNIEMILQYLQDSGFKANLCKSFFMQKSVEYLGYQLTHDGLECQPKKLKVIQSILSRTSVKQLNRYLGKVTFYCIVFAKQSHILGPLTDLVGKCGKTKNRKEKLNWCWEKVH